MDILFLLKPNFTDSKRDTESKQYYCPDCAFLEGVLSYYPELRSQLDIRYIGFEVPRKEIVDLVGDAHQGCPNLILDPANNNTVYADAFYTFGDKLYTSNTKLLVNYLTEKYGIAEAHF
jgi:hypothetical protein